MGSRSNNNNIHSELQLIGEVWQLQFWFRFPRPTAWHCSQRHMTASDLALGLLLVEITCYKSFSNRSSTARFSRLANQIILLLCGASNFNKVPHLSIQSATNSVMWAGFSLSWQAAWLAGWLSPTAHGDRRFFVSTYVFHFHFRRWISNIRLWNHFFLIAKTCTFANPIEDNAHLQRIYWKKYF